MFTIDSELLEYNDNCDQVVSRTPVKIVAWDRDKYFYYENGMGEIRSTKCYWLSIKRSNQLHLLPEVDYMSEEFSRVYVTKKQASKEIKEGYKKKHKYWVGDKDFNSLRKAFRFLFDGVKEGVLCYRYSEKSWSSTGPLYSVENGEYTYYGRTPRGVSEKTLRKA